VPIHLKMVGGLAVAAVLAFGSSANAAPMPEQMPIPSDSQSLVYIFRPPAIAWAGRGSNFLIDGVKVVVLGYNGCTAMIVPSGRHKLEQKWPLGIILGGRGSVSLPVEWEGGQSYYYTFNTSFSLPTYQMMEFEWEIHQVDRTYSESASKCRFTPPVNLPKIGANAPEHPLPAQASDESASR